MARRRLTRAHRQLEFNDCIKTGRKARPPPRHSPVSLTLPDDVTQTPIHLAEWPSAFNGYLSRLHMSVNFRDVASRLGALVRHLGEGLEGFERYSTSLSVFSDVAFDRALEKVSSGKSPGSDGVPYECWGQGGPRLKESFLSLCRARFCNAASALAERVEAVLADTRPGDNRTDDENGIDSEKMNGGPTRFKLDPRFDDQAWRVHLAFLVPKIGRPQSLSDYRSIAVINSAKKLYLRMLSYSFEECLPTNLGIIGGLGGVSTSYLQLLTSVVVEKTISWNVSYCIAKLDLTRAYTYLDPTDTAEILLGYGVSREIILGLLQECSFQALSPNLGSSEVPEVFLGRGTPEGAPHSGLMLRALLSRVLEDLVPAWSSRGLLLRLPAAGSVGAAELEIRPYVWIDDFVIFAGAIGQMETIISELSTSLVAVKQAIHPKKTVWIASKEQQATVMEVEGCLVTRSQSLSVLGVTITPPDTAPKCTRNLEHLKTNFRKAWNAFHANAEQITSPHHSEKQRIFLCTSFVLPVITFGISSLTLLQNDLRDIDSVYASILFKALRLRRQSHVPLPIHRILATRYILSRFSSNSPFDRIPCPSQQYFKGVALLVKNIITYPHTTLSQAIRWRSTFEWETSKRGRTRATHSRPGPHTLWERWIHQDASKFNAAWYNRPVRLVISDLESGAHARRIRPPPRRSEQELIDEYHRRTRQHPVPVPSPGTPPLIPITDAWDTGQSEDVGEPPAKRPANGHSFEPPTTATTPAAHPDHWHPRTIVGGASASGGGSQTLPMSRRSWAALSGPTSGSEPPTKRRCTASTTMNRATNEEPPPSPTPPAHKRRKTQDYPNPRHSA